MVAAPKPAAAAPPPTTTTTTTTTTTAITTPTTSTTSTRASAVVAGNGEIKGRSVSGRFWRSGDNKRASTLITKTNPKTLSTSWGQKLAIRERAKAVKERQQEMRDERRAEIDKKKVEREERLKRRMENEFKTSTYQMITKTEKIKAMSKKQLRQIKKTQMNRMGQVELVSPWQDPRKVGRDGKPLPKEWVKRGGKKKF